MCANSCVSSGQGSRKPTRFSGWENVTVNGQKKLIELFGDYWHNKKHFPQSNDEQSLSQHYKKYGFKCLIIWEKELKNSEKVIQKIREFEYG
jgi:G:T-mismatch repair DNA endonuclease (very short patch repair protein)